MKDYLVKALAFDGEVRAYSVRTTNTVSEAQRRHDTWRTASAALGRSLTAGTMMGAMLKGDQKLTIKVEGKWSDWSYLSRCSCKWRCTWLCNEPTC